MADRSRVHAMSSGAAHGDTRSSTPDTGELPTNTPRLGFGLPSFGPYAGPEAITDVARAAERLGFDSGAVRGEVLPDPAGDRRAQTGERPAPLVIEAGARSAVERAARLGAGFVTVVFPHDWDTARTQIGWYRDAGGAGPLVIRILAVSQDTPDPVATLVDGARE
ncbi:hypothetical protein [Streptomyces sp. NPDC059262]|uniref:hypothetical protein n=1 Tax=Streptomyces sp. NPDC059262 TaxID=3346797 RepID=UPI0036A71D7B